MRDIEFRGKYHIGETDELIWVYGFYDGDEIISKDGDSRKVNDDSICQYTGMKDENGVKIYEGDVVETKSLMIPLITGVLIYSNRLGAYMIYREDGNGIFVMQATRFKLLGNIFDDTELEKKFGEIYRSKE